LPSPKLGWEKDLTVASFGDTPPPSLRGVRHCVILSRGDDVSPQFLASLASQGIETAVSGQPLVAFAELLRRERGHRPSEWGLPTSIQTALIVADRDRWERLDLFLDAVRVQLPQVAVWVAAANLLLEVREIPAADDLPAYPESPQLRLAGLAPVIDADSKDVGGPRVDAIAPPPQATSGLERAPDAEPALGSEPTETPERIRGTVSAAVTPEEIEMLLRLFPTGNDGDRHGQPPTGGGES
jgi:hypothetical protein